MVKTEAGKVFLMEEWLKGKNEDSGEEFSLFIVSDGKHYQILGSAQDHKRVNNFDEGENTGGMGCSSPPLVLIPKLLQKIEKTIIKKTISGLQKISSQ